MIHRFQEVWPRTRGAAAYAILGMLAVVFFLPFFLGGKIFLASDTLYSHYPWAAYAPADFRPHNPLITDPVNGSYAAIYNRQLKTGTWSDWNPFILAGSPASFSTSMGTYGRHYPPKLLIHRFLSVPVATTLLLFLHVAAMGWSMFLYLSGIGVGRRGALFGAVAYMFNGCAMVWLEFEMWVYVSAYFPLLLLVMERYAGERRLLYGFAGGGVLGLTILTQGYHLIIYVLVFMFFYACFMSMRLYRGAGGLRAIGALWGCWAVTLFTGFLIGSVDLLPFAEQLSQSSRIARTFGFTQFFETMGRVPLKFFVSLLFPDFFGNPVYLMNLIPRLPTQEYMNYNELSMYAGVPTLFAALALPFALRRPHARFYIFMVVLVAAMMTGSFVYYPFFRLVPGMDKLNPTRLVFLFVFAVSVAAGLGLQALGEMGGRARKIFSALVLLLFTAALVLALWGGSSGAIRWFNSEQAAFTGAAFSGFMETAAELRSISSPVIYRPLLLAGASAALILLLGTVRGRRTGVAVFGLLLVLLSYDLISFGRFYNTTVSPRYIYAETPAIRFLQKQHRPFRVMLDGGSGLLVNSFVPFGIEEIGGYSSAYPERLNKVFSFVEYGMSALQGTIFDRWVVFSYHSSPLLDMMNVRYVLASPMRSLENPKLKLVFRNDLAVYENTRALDRAYVVYRHVVRKEMTDILSYMGYGPFDMRNEVVLEEPPAEFVSRLSPSTAGTSAAIDSYTPDEVRITADLAAPGWLVLTDTWYPGWVARADGRVVPILRANGAFRAVALDRGRHEVVFSYSPRSVRIGRVISLSGAALSILGLFLVWRRRPERPPAGH